MEKNECFKMSLEEAMADISRFHREDQCLLINLSNFTPQDQEALWEAEKEAYAGNPRKYTQTVKDIIAANRWPGQGRWQ